MPSYEIGWTQYTLQLKEATKLTTGIEPPTPIPRKKSRKHKLLNVGANPASRPKMEVRSNVPLKAVVRPNESESIRSNTSVGRLTVSFKFKQPYSCPMPMLPPSFRRKYWLKACRSIDLLWRNVLQGGGVLLIAGTQNFHTAHLVLEVGSRQCTAVAKFKVRSVFDLQQRTRTCNHI